ncbi:MAG: L-aspartate oxidase [Bacteroidales bacterium]
MDEMQRYDYLIAGSGLAGLYAAFRASRYGSVAIITKCKITDSNTFYAQGGIAAVTNNEDKPEFHFNDTIVAGRELCDHSAVNILVNEGPQRIKEFIIEGMNFDKSGGELSLGLEGGHHQRRVLHAGGDITGRRITEFMIEKIRSNSNITLFENHQALQIETIKGKCQGLRVWNFDTCKEEFFKGNHTILALGGASAIYQRTTNPKTTIGEGVALCYEAGCRVSDMEFIQFHPTTLHTKENNSYLISEAVRGEGAHLINENGERFMLGIHPLAELAPRDIVAKAIFNQKEVHLSLSHLDPERIKTRFPNIFKTCCELGIDMREKIPVAPAAHYMVGGVKTDLNGQTDIVGLYACGELASTGIMGANRLASNSLAECLVFGYRAIEHTIREKGEPTLDREEKSRPTPHPIFYFNSKNENFFISSKEKISSIMTQYAGIIRNQDGLLKGVRKLGQIEQELNRLQEKEVLLNLKKGTTLKREYYLSATQKLITVAQLIIEGALFRKESRGGHFRDDFPIEESKQLYHSIQQKGKKIKKEIIMSVNNLIEKLIELAIEEDTGAGDVTTNSLIPAEYKATATLTMKANGVISGLKIIKKVFEHFDKEIVFESYFSDGDKVKEGDLILKIEGSYRALLTGERTALNILQRMSGIATATAAYVKELEGSNSKLLDTRKTAPGMRILDKMAVVAGGGKNHRVGLYDMALIKDNHIKIAGGISNAVEQVRKNIGSEIKIEVETTNLQEVKEALESNAHIIMLDNMDNKTMKEAVVVIGDRAQTEASGNMTLERIKGVAQTGVNYISVGALTHSVTALDISMNISIKS